MTPGPSSGAAAEDWRAAAAAARAFEARHETIDNFRYPDGIRIAVNFTADFDAMLYRRALEEPPMQKAKGEFGGRVGIWRLIELFDTHGVKATFFTPGRICELYPQALRAAAASGHELADHMWEHLTPKTEELQRDHIRRTTDALTRIGGVRPIGTRSYYGQAVLKDEGYLYNSAETTSRLPYYAADDRLENCLLILPFHFSIDDAQFYNFGWFTSEPQAQRLTDPQRVIDMWWDAFEQQYESGNGYLNICLHPFVSGRALRTRLLGQLIERMKGKEGVWFPTCAALAQHVLANFPPRSLKF